MHLTTPLLDGALHGCISSSPFSDNDMGSAELTMIWHISVPPTFPLKRTSFTVKPLGKCAQCAHK